MGFGCEPVEQERAAAESQGQRHLSPRQYGHLAGRSRPAQSLVAKLEYVLLLSSAMAPGCQRIGRSTIMSTTASDISWSDVTRCPRMAPAVSRGRRCSAHSECSTSGVSIWDRHRVPRSEASRPGRHRYLAAELVSRTEITFGAQAREVAFV
jgi:hypothetical protein